MARHARVCTFAGSCVSASSGTVLVLRCVSYPPASPPPLGFRAPDRDRRSIDGSIDRSGFAPSYVVPRNRGVLETHDGRRRRVKKLKEKEKKSETKTLLGLSVDRSSIYIEVPRKYPMVRPAYCPVPPRPPPPASSSVWPPLPWL